MPDPQQDQVADFLADAQKRYEVFGESDAMPRLLAAVEAVLALTRDTDGNDLPGSAEVPVGEFQAAITAALLGERTPGD